MKKLFLLNLFLFIIVIQLNSAVFDYYQDLNVLKSDNFDIIFDDSSIEEGYMIYDNCEKIYSDINTFFGLNRTQHIKVVITSDIQYINAYFSLFPSPHIVLYNTIGVNNELNMFSNNYLLNIFKHELTHALTLMGENTFARRTFSQALTYSLLNITSFNAEGFAVLSESQNGEGRLNSSFYKSRLIQAKLENKLLKYNEVQGNRDIYPSDVFYLYGAFFNKYLLDTYGIDKYREYLNQLLSPQLFFLEPNFAFKKVYNTSIYGVWNDFEDSILILQPNDIEYKTLDFKPSSIVKANDSIYVYDKNNDSIKDIKTNKTITKFLNNTYAFTYNDEKLVASSFKADPLHKTQTVIVSNNKKNTIDIENFKMGIAYKDYIVGIYSIGQNQYIGFSQDNKIIKKISISDNEYIQKFDIINDRLVYLSKNDGKDVITIIIDDSTKKVFAPVDNMEILNFSVAANKIILSTVENNQLPRLSIIDLYDSKFYSNSFDVNGGINNPILINNELYYIAKLFESNELRTSSFENFNLIEREIKIETEQFPIPQIEQLDLNRIQKYNVLKYMLQGSFLPAAIPDGTGILSLLYFYSVDPAEFVTTQFMANSSLYGDFETNLVLNLTSTTGYKYTGLYLEISSLLANPVNNTFALLEQSFTRQFALQNNKYIIYSNINTTDFETAIISLNELGMGFSTKVGPTKFNIFNTYISYQPIISWDIYTNKINLNNYMKFGIQIPYLIPFIKNDKSTWNMPIKANIILDINDLSYSYDISLLLFNIEIQKAFEKFPLYFHDIQTYLYYENKTEIEISAYTIFSTSVTQSTLSNIVLNPGLNYTYNFTTRKFNFGVNLYASF